MSVNVDELDITNQSDAEKIATAIGNIGFSEARMTSDGEPSNIADGLFAIARALDKIAQQMPMQQRR